ncbi:MAG: hypothetical protein R2788_06620 [Saprospiraceae bacterium]
MTNPINGCSTTRIARRYRRITISLPLMLGTTFYTCVDTVFHHQSVITAQGSGARWILAGPPRMAQLYFPTNILQPTVNCRHLCLTVTDLVNNCVSVSSVTVLDATTPPVADAGLTAEINCNNLAPQLDGSNSTLLANWTSSGQPSTAIFFRRNDTMPTIDSARTNWSSPINSTNAKDTASVVITGNADIPPVNAGADIPDLHPHGVEPKRKWLCREVDIIYEWTGRCIVSNANSLQPLNQRFWDVHFGSDRYEQW